ncbi:hypothetical protein K438DRAFT_1952951 [Mycena galopus ATCC 62051]|nr:hypothetical protein K438DRAFT_1952951 [Mycena galopus ATCC 62051]
MDSNNSVILGLGTGVGMADVLPLKNTFFDWCSEYFIEPQMKQAEADELGSIQFNYQLWRQQRNGTVIDETQRRSQIAELRPWDRPVATLQVSGHPLTMVFPSFDKHLFIANDPLRTPAPLQTSPVPQKRALLRTCTCPWNAAHF